MAPTYTISDVQISAEIILFGDSALILGASYRIDDIGSMFSTGTLHVRQGESRLVAWGDGHAKAHRLSYVPFTIPGDNYKLFHAGFLWKYPLQATNDSMGSIPSDWYFYNLKKPTAP